MIREILQGISLWAIPVLLVGIPLIGMIRGVKVYDVFIEGAKEGFQVAVRIIPFLVGILVAIGMFRASGAMDMLTERAPSAAQPHDFSARAFSAGGPAHAQRQRLARADDRHHQTLRPRLDALAHGRHALRQQRDALLRARRLLRRDRREANAPRHSGGAGRRHRRRNRRRRGVHLDVPVRLGDVADAVLPASLNLDHFVSPEPGDDQAGAEEDEEVDRFACHFHRQRGDPAADEESAEGEQRGADDKAVSSVAKGEGVVVVHAHEGAICAPDRDTR